MLNAEKDVKTKETETKKVLEATEKVRKKTEKEPKEVSKRNKILYGFEGGLKKNDINNIPNMSDAPLRQYIH